MYIHPVQIIIILALVIAMLAARMAYSSARLRRAQREPSGAGPEELSEVKKRVQVLERIVTDKEHSLSREIEQLHGR